MRDRTVAINVTANIAGLQARMKAATGSVRSFAADAHTSLQKNRADWADLSSGIGKVGLALLGAATVSTRGFATFDRSMSKVKATGSEAAGAIDELREAAIKAGADTQYSASEAADAITDLAKAGVSARDILGGGLTGALNLAAAGELEVKEAAEITATALAQFKLQGTQAAHVADLLAAGAGKAMGDVTDLGMALRQGGLVAAQTGLTVEETTAALSAFAQQGLLGSDAGTSLKTMLQRLTPQSKEAQAQFDALGISAYDSQGQFVGLANFAGQLKDQMGGLSPEVRNAAMGVMFGNDAVRAANVLYSEGADGIRDWVSTVNDAGFAARQAATLTDNLLGDLERLGGSMETAFIRGGGGVNDWLRGLAQGADKAVDAVGQIPAPMLSAATRMTALAGVAGVVTAVTIKGVSAFSDYQASLARISETSPRMGRALTGATKAARALGIALATIQVGAIFGEMSQSGIDKSLGSIADMTNALSAAGHGSGLEALDAQLQKVQTKLFFWQTGASYVNDVGSALRQAKTDTEGFAGGMNSISSGIAGLFGAKTAVGELQDQISKLDSSFATLDGDSAAQAFRQVADSAKAEGLTMAEVAEFFPEYKAKLAAIATQYGVTLESGDEWARWMAGQVPPAVISAAHANGDLVDSFGVVEGAATQAKLSVEEFLDSLFKAERGVLSVSDAQIRMEEASDQARDRIKDWTAELESKYRAQGKGEKEAKRLAEAEVAAAIKSGKALDINTKAGRENRSALNEHADASMAAMEAMIRNGEATTDVEATAKRARKAFIANAEAMGMGKTEAAELADELGLIPSQVVSEIETKLDRDGIDEWKKYKPPVKTGLIKTKVSGEYIVPGTGGTRLGKAGGGEVSGPGTSTSDSIAAWLSDGEHVLTASDVAAMGGHAAVYRLRAMAQAGRMPRFAGGGAVSLDAQLERLQLQTEIRDLKADLAEKETYKSKGKKKKRYKLRDLDRDEAQLQLEIAQAELSAFDLGIERLRDLAGSKVSQLESIASSVKSGIGGFDLRGSLGGSWSQQRDANGNIWYSSAAGSTSSMTSAAAAKAVKVRTFAGKLQQLAQAGMAAAVLQDIASLGVDEGSRAADSFLADTTQIATMNEAYAQIETWSAAAGQYVTEASYTGGLKAAQAMADTLESEGGSIGSAIAQGFATSLGYSGSLAKRAAGGPVTAGQMYQVNELGVEAFVPAVNGYILTAGQTAAATQAGTNVSIQVTAINPQAESALETTNKGLQLAAAALGGGF